MNTSDSRLGSARRAVCGAQELLLESRPRGAKCFLPRAEPRSVPRAEPRGTYTHKTLVSAPLDEQLERSERTHPALWAPLSMRGK